jgi:hypothetical protein
MSCSYSTMRTELPIRPNYFDCEFDFPELSVLGSSVKTPRIEIDGR